MRNNYTKLMLKFFLFYLRIMRLLHFDYNRITEFTKISIILVIRNMNYDIRLITHAKKPVSGSNPVQF